MYWKYFASWAPGVPIAILNGLLRELWYKEFLGELSAHQLSALSFILLFGLYVWFVLPWIALPSSGAAWTLGLVWLAITVAFEFLFGHYVMGHPWERLVHDYNLLAGRVWVLVLVWIVLAPTAFYRIRRPGTFPSA